MDDFILCSDGGSLEVGSIVSDHIRFASIVRSQKVAFQSAVSRRGNHERGPIPAENLSQLVFLPRYPVTVIISQK
jgi:hypothetical protein